MKASLKLALSIGLMATLALPGILPALAAETPPGEASSEAAKTTAIIKKEAGPYAELDARMVWIERRIVEGLSNGRLTPQEAEELKTALDGVAETEAQFRQNPAKFTNWQITKMSLMLDKVSDLIDHSERDRDLASADLQFTREDIKSRIDRAATHGRLTPQEVADLKQRYQKIYGMEVLLQRKQGKLSYLDKLALCIDYDNLTQRLSKNLSARPVAIPDTVAGVPAIEKRLEEGVKAGKISEAKAQEFKQKISEIRATAETFKKSGTSMSADQVINLGLSLDDLGNRIELLHETPKDVNTRLKEIDKKLASGLDEGSLTPLETVELKEDYDSIVAAKEKLTAGGQLKDEDSLALKLDLARLEGRIDRQIHNPSRLWSGIVVRIAHLSHRNKASLEAKRLSADEARSFLKELTGLNKKRFEMSKADNGMTAQQAIQLAEELQGLGGRLDKQTKDRDMELPNIDSLRQAIDNRIGESAVLGQMSAGDARTAVLALGDLNSVKEKYNASESELSAREKFAIAFELERLASNLEEQMHGHEAFFPGLEKRRGQIEALINEGLSSGRLSSVNAELYRQKLAENTSQEKQYRNNSIGLTGDKALDLVSGLEHLWQQVDRDLREKQVMTSDLVSLEGNVEKKIRQGFSDGVLTPTEAENLRATFDGTVGAFNKMRATDGGLSYGERLAFAYAFQRMSADVERNLHESTMMLPMMDRAHADLEQKLGNLLATGRLSPEDTQELKQTLDNLASATAEKRASGGGISYQECMVIAVDMNRLNKRIEHRAAALKSPLPNVDVLQADLSKKIEEAKVKGTISAAEYKELKADMDRLSANEAAFRISDEALNYAEATNLMQAIQQLNSRLSAPKKNSASKDSSKKK